MNPNTLVDVTTALSNSPAEFFFFFAPLIVMLLMVSVVLIVGTRFLNDKTKTVMISIEVMEERHRKEREEQNKFIRSLSETTINQGNLFVKLAESIHENTEATREMVRAVADMSNTVGYCRAINNIKTTQKKAKIKNVELRSTN